MYLTLLISLLLMYVPGTEQAGNPDVPEQYQAELYEIEHNFRFNIRNNNVDVFTVYLNRLYEMAGNDTTGYVYAYALLKESQIFEGQQRYNKSIEKLYQAYRAADANGHESIAFRALASLSMHYDKIGNIERAGEYLEHARTMKHVYENSFVDQVFFNFAEASYIKNFGGYYESLELYINVKGQLEELVGQEPTPLHKIFLSTVYSNMALMFTELERYDQALPYYNLSMELSREMGDLNGVTRVLNNMNILYSDKGEYDKAIDLLEEAIQINTKQDRPVDIIRNLYNIGLIYLNTGEYDEAISTFEKGLLKSEEMDALLGILHHTYGLGQANNLKGDLDTARTYLKIAEEIAEQTETKYILSNALDQRYQLEKNAGNYETALVYLERFKVLDDEYKELARNRALDELIIQHRVETTRSENEFLSERLELEEAANRNMMIFIAVLLFLVILTVGFAYYFFNTREKLQVAYKALEHQKKRITFKNKKLERIGRERNALLRVIIHDLRNPLSTIDGASQILKASDNGLGRLSQDDEEELVDIISNSTKRLNLLINSLLNIFSKENMDVGSELETVDLSGLFNQVIDEYRPLARQKFIRINHDLKSFKSETHTESVNGVISNLLSNAIKYSPEYSQVYIELNEYSNYWEFRIRDEGPGFTEQDQKEMFKMFSRLSASPTGDETSTGVGLYSVRMSVERLGGTVELNPEYHNGAEFICRFPHEITEDLAYNKELQTAS